MYDGMSMREYIWFVLDVVYTIIKKETYNLEEGKEQDGKEEHILGKKSQEKNQSRIEVA